MSFLKYGQFIVVRVEHSWTCRAFTDANCRDNVTVVHCKLGILYIVWGTVRDNKMGWCTQFLKMGIRKTYLFERKTNLYWAVAATDRRSLRSCSCTSRRHDPWQLVCAQCSVKICINQHKTAYIWRLHHNLLQVSLFCFIKRWFSVY